MKQAKSESYFMKTVAFFVWCDHVCLSLVVYLPPADLGIFLHCLGVTAGFGERAAETGGNPYRRRKNSSPEQHRGAGTKDQRPGQPDGGVSSWGNSTVTNTWAAEVQWLTWVLIYKTERRILTKSLNMLKSQKWLIYKTCVCIKAVSLYTSLTHGGLRR